MKAPAYVWGAEHDRCLQDGPHATQLLNLFSACLLSVRRYMPITGSTVDQTIIATTAGVASFEACLQLCNTDNCTFVTYDYDNGDCTTVYAPAATNVA